MADKKVSTGEHLLVMRLVLSLMCFFSLGVFSCSTKSFFVMPRKVVHARQA